MYKLRPPKQKRKARIGDSIHLLIGLDLTQDEKEAIVQSSDFVNWFSKTSKIVERALYATEQYDITVDYSAVDENSNRR